MNNTILFSSTSHMKNQKANLEVKIYFWLSPLINIDLHFYKVFYICAPKPQSNILVALMTPFLFFFICILGCLVNYQVLIDLICNVTLFLGTCIWDQVTDFYPTNFMIQSFVVTILIYLYI